MFESRSEAIYELLREQKCVGADRLETLRNDCRLTGKSLADALIEHRLVTRAELLAAIATELGFPLLAEPPTVAAGELAEKLPAAMVREYGIIPWREAAGTLELLVADPFVPDLWENLTFALGRPLRLTVCDPERVAALVRRHYGEEPIAGVDTPRHPVVGEHGGPSSALSLHDLEAMAGQAPVIRFANQVLADAIRHRASDIHFEPFEHEFKIRTRVDGVLAELPPPPVALALPVVSRIKVLANLNIAERRLPQDGRIRTTLGGRAVDLRVSTLPTQFGESVVVRVLDQSAVRLELAELGLPDDVLAGVLETIRRPNGIFLVTGPTGSGKTTTLYGALNVLNSPGRKLLTIEDPVEYEIEGIMQVPVNPLAGLSFGSALRSFMRQDPDVVMVGEIRDLETAQIALQASLTGHLVLSTLHTNDAAAAVSRLIDMGAEPFLLAATLEGVLAQRLVRRICPHCRATYRPSAPLLAQLELNDRGASERSFFHGAGCDHCSQTGYLGRLGIFEWLVLTEPLRELAKAKVPVRLIRQKARELGMRTLREDALRAVDAGNTTLEEILKYT